MPNKNHGPMVTLLSAGLLAGCAGLHPAAPVRFDLGNLGPAGTGAQLSAALTVANVTAAPWLDNRAMHYRLNYADDQQPRAYTDSRWSVPPPQLLNQRIKARMAQAGNVVLSGTDGAVDVAILRIDADDFSQRFSSPTQSEAHVSLRASVFQGRALLAQRSFEQQHVAATADAAGGARALAAATDDLIGEMTTWLATLPMKK